MIKISAQWLWSASTDWLSNVELYIQDQRIVDIQPCSQPEQGILFPGFINLHTHLELSSLCGKLQRGLGFSAWVGHLRQNVQNWSQDDWNRSLDLGQRQALASGTTSLLDIGNSGANALVKPCLRIWNAKELIGFDPAVAPKRLHQGREWINSQSSHPWRHPFLCPHAPYSVSVDLMAELLHQKPWCIHLAESQEEELFFRQGQGQLANYVHSISPDIQWQIGIGPLEYLNHHQMIPTGGILVHCNHFNASDLALAQLLQCTVVHCPRSRHFFQHQNADLEQWIHSKVNIAIATDSLASNDSLSIWDELDFLYQSTSFDLETLLIWATRNPAQALNFHGGDFQKGYWGDWQRIAFNEGSDPRELLKYGSPKVIQVGIDGQVQFSNLD